MQQANRKHRFNAVDLIITLVIVAVIAAVVYIFFLGDDVFGGTNTVKIQYTLEVRDERDELISAASMNIGKTLVEGTSKYALGEVVDLYTTGAKYSTWDATTGQSTVSDYPEHSDICFVVNADATLDPENGRYSIGGFEMSVGSLVYLRLPYYAGTAYCTEVNLIGE